jgi:flagellar biosynthetic protein FliR
MTFHINPDWVYFYFLYYFRILFFLLPLPLFTPGVLPLTVLAYLVFALSWLFVQMVPPQPNLVLPTNLAHLGILIFKEALLGFILGFFVRLIFTLFTVFGEIVTLHVGLGMTNMVLPGFGHMTVFGNLFRIIGTLIFLSAGGLEVIFYGLKLSFEVIPPTHFNPFVLDYKMFSLLLVKVFSIALAMALPFIAVYMLINIVLAITNRLVPNVNIFFVGYPVYMLANFALLVVLIPSIVYLGQRYVGDYLKMFIDFIRSFPTH